MPNRSFFESIAQSTLPTVCDPIKIKAKDDLEKEWSEPEEQCNHARLCDTESDVLAKRLHERKHVWGAKVRRAGARWRFAPSPSYIDVLPGTKYCITRLWPLPKEQVEAIDEFFAQRAKAGHVRESKSPHCSPTFCVKKATGGWRIVHAFNKLNDATIPAQTPVPRKNMILDGMVGSTVFSAIDLKDGFYQIRMREDDVPLTAVSTPSGMLWEWSVMPQGLKNAPATFNRMVTNVLRPLRTFAPSYFDDIFVHSRA
ncbi:reverse transcriptase, partial [Globisporangium splendens]